MKKVEEFAKILKNVRRVMGIIILSQWEKIYKVKSHDFQKLINFTVTKGYKTWNRIFRRKQKKNIKTVGKSSASEKWSFKKMKNKMNTLTSTYNTCYMYTLAHTKISEVTFTVVHITPKGKGIHLYTQKYLR